MRRPSFSSPSAPRSWIDPDPCRPRSEGNVDSNNIIVYVPRERTIGDMVRRLKALARVVSEEGAKNRVEFL